ncbi:MAG TPA: hypothetical protein VKM93_02080 [Terriglobia bacterium]|nr:hypothetical protein [Terriglobia bacterium]
MKLAWRVTCIVFLVISLVQTLSAQDGSQSLGDFARQDLERRNKQAAEAEANETAGLKEGSFKANILITDSHAAIERWVLMSATDRPNAGRLRELIPDKKFYLPFVVTDYPFSASEKMDLTARVRLISPDGKTKFAAPRFSGAIAPDPRSPSVIVLNPVMDITFDTSDPPSTYTVRVTITDHVHSAYAKAEEQFQFILAKGRKGEAAKEPAAAGTEP